MPQKIHSVGRISHSNPRRANDFAAHRGDSAVGITEGSLNCSTCSDAATEGHNMTPPALYLHDSSRCWKIVICDTPWRGRGSWRFPWEILSMATTESSDGTRAEWVSSTSYVTR